MSSAQCQAGDNQGFPLLISQSLQSNWPGVELSDVLKKIKRVTVQNEYSVKWPTPSNNVISVVKPTVANNVLQVTGLDNYTDATTMSYGDASYKCSNILSIVQNQHSFFSSDRAARFEAILSFQITNKNANPSSPDIILFCRPLSYNSSYSTPPMWSAIDSAASSSSPKTAPVDLSSLYAYNSSMLMPVITYQTCIPVKLIKDTGNVVQSLRIRVNVVMQPLNLNLSSTDLSTSLTKYTLPTNPANLFTTSLSPPTIQFKDGNGPDGFPVHTNTNLRLALATRQITDLDNVLNTIEVQVPEQFLGKSLNDISSASTPPTPSSKKRAYKCYTIDPKKDIVDGQIMVDPTTGLSLESKIQAEIAGGTNIGVDANVDTGIMPGDVESAVSVTATVIGTLGLVAYLLFILLKGREIYIANGHYGDLSWHIITFIVILIALSIFGVQVEKSAEAKHNSK